MAFLDETGLAALWQDVKAVAGKLTGESDGTVRGSIAELTAKGHAEQDGTPTPDFPVPIQVVTGHTVTGKTGQFVDLEVQGKNLFSTEIGAFFSGNDSEPSGYKVAHSSAMRSYVAEVSPNATYTLSANGGNRTIVGIVDSLNPTTCLRMIMSISNTGTVNQTFATQEDEHYVMAYLTNDVSTAPVEWAQLELGTKATEYEPYYHTVTPIPLPDRGWVAGLPDDTADSLLLDGAGKVEWELVDDELVLNGSGTAVVDEAYPRQGNYFGSEAIDDAIRPDVSNNVSAANFAFASYLVGMTSNELWNSSYEGTGFAITTAGNNRMVRIRIPAAENTVASANAYLSEHPLTILYPLATPVTEECGYVEDWPTDIPEGATVTIPELSEVGIKFFIDSSVTELAKQWYERAQSEYEDRLASLEDAVAQLIAEG